MLPICASPIGQREAPRFVKPPWAESSFEWRKLDGQLPSDHLARQLVAAVGRLNLQPLWDSYSLGGTDALRPDLMLNLVLVEMWSGRRRPSQWFRDATENIALQWAGFGVRPSRSSWYNFRDRLGPLIDDWFAQALDFARELGLTSGTRGALDGSFAAAHASRHRLLNEECLEKRASELAARDAVAPAERLADAAPAWMAKTPATRSKQRAHYAAAGVRMQELQATNRRQPSTRRRAVGKIVVSATEPAAAIGRDKENVFRPLFTPPLPHVSAPRGMHNQSVARALGAS